MSQIDKEIVDWWIGSRDREIVRWWDSDYVKRMTSLIPGHGKSAMATNLHFIFQFNQLKEEFLLKYKSDKGISLATSIDSLMDNNNRKTSIGLVVDKACSAKTLIHNS